MLPMELQSPREVARELADRVRVMRLERAWTQKEMAERAGVALATYRRFETEGLVSLERLLSIAQVLDALPQFDVLFRQRAPDSLDELERRETRRQRGKRRDAKA